jgi:hypothetical protein
MYKLNGLRWPLFLIPSISNLNDTKWGKEFLSKFYFFSKKKDLRSHTIACSCKYWNISSEKSKGKNKGHFLGKTIIPKNHHESKDLLLQYMKLRDSMAFSNALYIHQVIDDMKHHQIISSPLHPFFISPHFSTNQLLPILHIPKFIILLFQFYPLSTIP